MQYNHRQAIQIGFRSEGEELTPKQKNLRRRVLNQIQRMPESFDMSDWEFTGKSCGTTRCLAGWAAFFEYGKDWADLADIETDGIRLLGLTVDEYTNGSGSSEDDLFFSDNDEALERFRKMTEETPASGESTPQD